MDFISRPETEEDRKKLEAAGIAHCPSCGNPTQKSDIFLLSTGRYCCLTEYFHFVLNKMRCRIQSDGSFIISVSTIPELRATGNTEEQCRLNLIEELKKWLEEQKRAGSAIPVI